MMVAGISIVGSHAVVSGAWGRAFPKYNYRMQVEFFVKVPINASGP